MAKTARAAIEDLLTCESCHAFYYVERAEDGARTRLRCTSCGHSRDVLLSGAKTNKWTVIDPNGELKTFTEWDDLVRTMSGSGVTAVHKKLPSDRPVSDRATSERPPVAERAPSNRPAVEAPAIPPMHEVQPIGPSVGPNGAAAATTEANEEAEDKPRPSMSGAALLDVTPTPMAPALSLEDSAPAVAPTAPAESDKSIDISMSEPALPAVPESKPEALVEALVSAMPEASAAPAAKVEKPADVAPVAVKQEPWDDDEAEVLSMRDIQVVPVAENSATPPDAVDSDDELKESSPLLAIGSPEIREKDKERDSKNSSTPPPPARGALKTLPPASPVALPPPTITFDDAKKSDPPPAVAKKDEGASAKSNSDKPKAKTDAKKSPDVRVRNMDADEDDDNPRTANTVPPKGRSSASGAKPVASAKSQVDNKPEEGGRSWLLPALGVAAAAGVVWYLANGQGGNTQTQTPTNPTATTATAAPTTTTASTEKPVEPATTTTTTTATATPSASAAPPVDKAAPANVVKPVDSAKPTGTGAPANGGGGTAAAKPNNANLSMSEALDKAGQAKRSGDYASAKDLYARVLKDSPGNVEAHSGLGDIAKAQGDLAAAKASYQKALASSPDYGPALLSLADTEWDMGDRAAAQARYAKIVAARGGSAPARAKERAGTE